MIKLACNYYRETEELVRDGKIDIDYFKFPSLGFQMKILKEKNISQFEDFALKLRKIKPILLHGLGVLPPSICSPNFKSEFQIDHVKKLIELTSTPGISLHLDGAEPSISRSDLLKIVINNVQFLKAIFPDLKFITLENVEKSKSPLVSEPEFISQVIRESEVGFLLDISHAFWCSKNRDETLEAYLNKLPLDKVFEIHINGWVEKDGDIMSHVKINDIAYDALKKLQNCCSPEIVTLEYGRHNDRVGCRCPVITPDSINDNAKKEIIEQIERLREII